MPWVRIDDGFPDHRKIAELGYYAPLAGWLFLCGLAYCNRQLTDGRIPKHHIHRLASFRHLAITNGMSGEDIDVDMLAALLVEVGLWEQDDDPDFFRVHDYLVYQPSREEIEAERQQKVEAGKQGGLASAKARAQAAAKARAKALAQAVAKAGGQAGATADDTAGALAVALAGAQAKSNPVPVPDPLEERTSQADRPGALRGKESEETQSPAGAKSTGPDGPDYARPSKVRTRPPEAVGFATLVQVAKAQRREHPTEERGDLLERCKAFCAASGLAYDSTVLHKALDAVDHVTATA